MDQIGPALYGTEVKMPVPFLFWRRVPLSLDVWGNNWNCGIEEGCQVGTTTRSVTGGASLGVQILHQVLVFGPEDVMVWHIILGCLLHFTWLTFQGLL